MRREETVTMSKRRVQELEDIEHKYKSEVPMYRACIAIMYNSKGTDFNFRQVDSKLAKSLSYNSRKDMIIDLKNKGYMNEDEETHIQKSLSSHLRTTPSGSTVSISRELVMELSKDRGCDIDIDKILAYAVETTKGIEEANNDKFLQLE